MALDYQTARFVASYSHTEALPASSLPEVSFVGRSNVGKSSLMNKVFARKGLVKVSATPGKTAAVNFFAVDTKAGNGVASKPGSKAGGASAKQARAGAKASPSPRGARGAHFVDLPGYGYAQVSKAERCRWQGLIEGYFEQQRRHALVVALVDMRHDASTLDLQMIDFLSAHELPYLVAFTKADKLSKNQQQKQMVALCKQLAATGDAVVLATSSADGTGISDLRTLIEDAIAQKAAGQ